MNYEKTCYSLIGCLIAGAVIQKNMDLPWQYFMVITLVLWGICIGVHWRTYKREQELKKYYDSQKQEIHNDELEKILTAVESSADKQIQCLKDEMNLLKETQTTAQKMFEEDIRLSLTFFEKTQKQIMELNQRECEYLDKAVSDLSNNLEYLEKIISMVTDAKNDNISSRKDLFNEMIAMMKENTLAGNKRIVEWQENYLGISSNMQSVLELMLDRMVEASKVENGVLKALEEIPTIVSNNQDIMLHTVKKDRSENAELIIQNISKIVQGLAGIKVINTDILKDMCMLTEAVNHNGKTIVEGISEKSTLLSESIKETDGIINEKLQQIQNSMDVSSSNVSNTLINMNNTTNDNIERISNEFKGIISNLQGTIDSVNQYLSDINCVENQNYGALEDIKNKMTEVETSINEGANSLSDSLANSMDKQGEIVSSEEVILERYDALLSRINDEIIVKMISDSNNLLRCMKDCYNLLESIRRAKR